MWPERLDAGVAHIKSPHTWSGWHSLHALTFTCAAGNLPADCNFYLASAIATTHRQRQNCIISIESLLTYPSYRRRPSVTEQRSYRNSATAFKKEDSFQELIARGKTTVSQPRHQQWLYSNSSAYTNTFRSRANVPNLAELRSQRSALSPASTACEV